MSIDPEFKQYPFISSYSSFGNNPIIYIDPSGETLRVATKEGQAQMVAILIEAFGENGNNFIFDKETNDMKFIGDPNSFSPEEAEVFAGLLKVMDEYDVTNVIFEKNEETMTHQGEATETNAYNSRKMKGEVFWVGDKENNIYIDPQEFADIIKIKQSTQYLDENNNVTDRKWEAKKDEDRLEVLSGTFSTVIEKGKSELSKSMRFFHGIGHVLFPANSEQSKVVDYSKKAGSIFKSKPENYIDVDKSHENKPD